MYLGKMKDALPYINKCLSKDPSNVGLRRLMAIVYGHMGWINESTQSEYDSLCETICEPSPFDYS